jgi:trehalose 6-phosphate synthase
MVFRSARSSCLHDQCQPGSVGKSTADDGFGCSSLPRVATCHARVWAELGLPVDALPPAGIDRLDYTKGVEERFLAVERMLEGRPALVGRFTFVQLAAPSRAAIDRHGEPNDAVEKLSERINVRFARDGWRPLSLRLAHHEPTTVFTHDRAADVSYLSSLHDRVNLVAKKLVAACDDEAGVLVLSRFAGAAKELPESLIVNPYDLEKASAALARAATMPREEQRGRMRAMRTHVAELGRLDGDIARLATISH